MTSPCSLMAGPPLFPQDAAASVWITGAPRASSFTLEILPEVTLASTALRLSRRSWYRTTPGKPRRWTGCPN